MARALLSVADKAGVVDLARGLVELGYEIVSTGGTARALAAEGVPVTSVEQVTGFPEVLGGRVKTLHPAIHAGILARRDEPAHVEELATLGIRAIDLVAVNLYPFREALRRRAPLPEAVEEIDIGGVALLRAAAKNFAGVIPLVDPADYGPVLAALRRGGLDLAARAQLAAKALRHTAAYDAVIAAYLAEQAGEEPFPERLTLPLVRHQTLRYGENPHQRAAFYRDDAPEEGLARAEVLHGKALSFNNLADADAAIALAAEFAEPCAVAIKHQNPCAVAIGETIAEAYQRAHDADPVSIFGGIVALTRPCDLETAERLRATFLEVVIAPDFAEEALAVLRRKRDLRLLRLPLPWAAAPQVEARRVWGGYLVQEGDALAEDPRAWRVVTRQGLAPGDLEEAWFAWRVVKHVKSNAIVVARGGVTLGIGAGQVNRIDAARQALARAGAAARGAVLASDAFFPFGDVVEEAARAGIRVIVQPGGSIRDEESIQGADRAGICMLLTGTRHFRH